MQLSDYLSIPYLLEARSVEIAPDVWVCHVAYPELDGCAAQAPRLEDAIRDLEKLRIQRIVELVRAGRTPPVPRPPLSRSDAVWAAQETGIDGDVVAAITQGRTRQGGL